MKKTTKLAGILTILAIIGVVFTGCDDGPPVLTGTVSIKGSAQIGQTLTANTDDLYGYGEIYYHWKRSGSKSFVSGSSYTITTADIDSTITVTVTRSGNSGSVTSAPTESVLPVDSTPGLVFTLINGGSAYSVSKGTATASNIIIPAIYKEHPVIEIEAFGFSSFLEMTSIIIPECILNIGNNAFCYSSNLESVTIPVSIINIGDFAFTGCSSLNTVYYHGTDNSTWNVINIGYNNVYLVNAIRYYYSTVFPGSYNTHWLYINGLPVIWEITPGFNFTLINNDTEYRVSKGSANSANLVIPTAYNGLPVTNIGSFQDCYEIINITIPSSVTSIDNGAFLYCYGLANITVTSGNTAYRSESNCLIEIATNTLILGCKNSLIPNGVTSIGNNAFLYCYGLTSITIPNSVTSIGFGAFYACTGLTSITIPNSVTSIGVRAFRDCFGLTSINIPSSVTSIGYEAFYRCIGLTSITIPSVTSIGNETFYGCSGLTSVTIPNSVTSIGWGAFGNCIGLTSVIIPNSVTSLSSTFSYCRSLTSVIIPDSITSIGESTFSYCTGLTNVTIPNSVTSIQSAVSRSGAFEGCTGLTSITIPNSVKFIGGGAFSGCIGLTSITIPNGVTSIGFSAFGGCSGLTSITIPSSVTNIQDSTFYGCSGLTSITVSNGNAVYRSETNRLIEISTNTLIRGCKNSLIPDSVTNIGNGAFSSCRSLTSVFIPDSITGIGYSAFVDCDGLKSVTLGTISSVNFHTSNSFPGNLRTIYFNTGGGAGTYTTANPGSNAVWVKK